MPGHATVCPLCLLRHRLTSRLLDSVTDTQRCAGRTFGRPWFTDAGISSRAEDAFHVAPRQGVALPALSGQIEADGSHYAGNPASFAATASAQPPAVPFKPLVTGRLSTGCTLLGRQASSSSRTSSGSAGQQLRTLLFFQLEGHAHPCGPISLKTLATASRTVGRDPHHRFSVSSCVSASVRVQQEHYCFQCHLAHEQILPVSVGLLHFVWLGRAVKAHASRTHAGGGAIVELPGGVGAGGGGGAPSAARRLHPAAALRAVPTQCHRAAAACRLALPAGAPAADPPGGDLMPSKHALLPAGEHCHTFRTCVHDFPARPQFGTGPPRLSPPNDVVQELQPDADMWLPVMPVTSGELHLRPIGTDNSSQQSWMV